MLKAIILTKKKPGMSRDAFVAHYEDVHMPIIKRLLGHLFVKHVRNYAKVPEGAQWGAEDKGFDAVAELWVKDQSALDEMARIIAIPENRALIRADEELFLDQSRTRRLIVDEVDNGTTL